MTPNDGRSNPYASPAIESRAPVARPAGQTHAPCPGCGAAEAKPISWTLWGGALGPRMFHHVRCKRCGAAYNGKTGQYNTTAITMYLLVSVAIGAITGGAGWFFYGPR